MTMSQAVTEPQAGSMSLSNGCDLSGKHRNGEPMDVAAGPAHSDDRMHVDEDLAAGQLCRRSTRVSALKAAEKIKLKDDVTGQEPGPADEIIEEKVDFKEPPNKKAKLADPKTMDQMSHTFYIQEQSDGTVIEVEEESDISSINSADAAALRAAYEKVLAKEPSAETLRERNAQIKELEANLRREEADLCLIKKVRTSQLLAQAESKKQAAAMNLNSGSGAYKPTVAVNKNGATNNNKGPTITNDAIKILLSLQADQQKEFIIKANKTNPTVVQQLVQAIAKSNIATQAQLQQLATSIQAAHAAQKSETAAAAAPPPKPQPPAEPQQNAAANFFTKNFQASTPQQRAAQARQAFRMQADKQLQQLVNNQKSAHADLQFIPNPNQADFCSLVALDIIVQRLRKDKTATADVTEAPYECEECHTDFTPSWKAIGVPGDMHLYCEACVKASQKKKALKDHTAFLRKAFNKVASQEKEFEKQIADGKLEQVLSQAMAASQQQATAASTSTPQNLSAKTNGTSSTTSTATKASAIPNTSKMTTTPLSSSTSTKKTTSSSSASSNSMNMTQMQMAMLMRSNPMMAAMMSQMNSQAMMQMYMNPMMMQMMAQHMQMQQAGRGSSSSTTSQQQQQQNYAMLLTQAAMSAGAGGGSNPLGNLSSAQMAALSSQLMSNPQMQRQLQEMMRQKAAASKK